MILVSLDFYQCLQCKYICFITRKPLQQHPISDVLGAESRGGHEKYQGHCGVIYEWYTQNVTILSATPPRGGCHPLTLTQKNKESFMYSQLERSSNRLDNVAPVWWSYILSCCEYLEDSLLFWVRVVGRQPLRGREGHRAQPPASDNIVIFCVDYSYIFPYNFTGTFHALPSYQGQECEGLGDNNFYNWKLEE